jgi:hypothetical protein
MAPVIDAWFVLVVSIASWMNREQDKALQYLKTENRVLKNQLKKRAKRIRSPASSISHTETVLYLATTGGTGKHRAQSVNGFSATGG